MYGDRPLPETMPRTCLRLPGNDGKHSDICGAEARSPPVACAPALLNNLPALAREAMPDRLRTSLLRGDGGLLLHQAKLSVAIVRLECSGITVMGKDIHCQECALMMGDLLQRDPPVNILASSLLSPYGFRLQFHGFCKFTAKLLYLDMLALA